MSLASNDHDYLQVFFFFPLMELPQKWLATKARHLAGLCHVVLVEDQDSGSLNSEHVHMTDHVFRSAAISQKRV